MKTAQRLFAVAGEKPTGMKASQRAYPQSCALRMTAPAAEGAKGLRLRTWQDFASAEARRWTEPVWQLSDRPRHPFGSLTFELVSYPTLAGRGGSVSRRDHNHPAGNRTPLTGGTNQEETHTPNASRSSGEGGWGEALLSEKRHLPQNLPSLPPLYGLVIA